MAESQANKAGKKPDTRKRISGGKIFYVISLRKAAFVDAIVGVDNIFAQSDKKFSEWRMRFHKHHFLQVFFRRGDVIIFVPKNRRRIIVIFEISEIRNS